MKSLELYYTMINFLMKGYIPQHRNLSPFFAYSTGFIHNLNSFTRSQWKIKLILP